MAQINLLPWREQERNIRKVKFLTILGFAASTTIVLMVLIHFYLSYLVSSQLSRNDFLTTQINQTVAENGDLKTQKQNALTVLKELQFIIGLQGKNYQTIRMLNELTRVTPAAIILTKLDKKDNGIILEGSAVSNTDVTQFIKAMSDSPVFTIPELNKIAANDKQVETRKNFQIKVDQKDYNAK